jgi:transcriptional regulator with XRE-family HTH domain
MGRRKFCSYMFDLRKRNNISQEKLSEELDCHPQTISRLEIGKHVPSKRLFKKLEKYFGKLGITYEEVKYENLLEIDWRGHLLLKSIKKGQLPEIERCLYKYKEILDEEKITDEHEAKEYEQFYRLGHLMANKRSGLDNKTFIEKLEEIFQIQRPLPDCEEIRVLSFNEIEFEILCMIADANRRLGNYGRAKELLEALLHNNMCKGNPLIKERYLGVASVLAKIYIVDDNVIKARECLGYSFIILRYKTDDRGIFDSLMTQLKICIKEGDEVGQQTINEFLECLSKLGKYIENKYEIQRGKNGWLL